MKETRHGIVRTLVVLALAWTATWNVAAERSPAGVAEALDGLPLLRPAETRRFYAERDGAPVWTPALLEQLRSRIRQADRHGLDPGDYHASRLLGARDDDSSPSEVDVIATDAFLALANHLLHGKVDPRSIEPTWNRPKRDRDAVVELQIALAEASVGTRLDDMQPDAAAYQVLREALALYRSATLEGPWPTIAAGPALKPGATGSRVLDLRQRLRATGLLIEDPEDDEQTFDAAMEMAVAQFQRRVGLEPDGVVGPATLAELNRTAEDRVGQIRVNLERWRWLPEEIERRHIRVNIADYRLEARGEGGIERVHDVIVGKRYRKTPVFSGLMTYLVFNPWWEVPPSLARLDKLPAFQKDPGSVERLGFEVYDRAGAKLDPASIDWRGYTPRDFPLRLRQRPGPHNALGQVKLMFPNEHNVYLHDSPTRELFARTERAFSSGCVRVRDPIGLAAWVLSSSPDWPRERIDRVLGSGSETRATVKDPVLVLILYFTAVAEPDGSLRLIHDVYDRDAPLLAALNRSLAR